MLEVVPSAGGEFGMLAYLARDDDRDRCGCDVSRPGCWVSIASSDLTYLQQRTVAALVLTHGHGDHIGAVPHVLP